MTVYPVGSKVLIDREVPGTIVAISLRGEKHAICYSVEWWDNRKIECREFDEFRVSPGLKGVQPVAVGFHGPFEETGTVKGWPSGR